MDAIAQPSDSVSQSDCWGYLRSVDVGRLAVVVDGEPEIFPVNYAVDHATVVFRTATGTKLAGAVGKIVAFEIDGYDEKGGAWSVILRGTASHIDDLHGMVEATDLPVFPIQPGEKPYFVRIVPGSLTGRHFTNTRAAE